MRLLLNVRPTLVHLHACTRLHEPVFVVRTFFLVSLHLLHTQTGYISVVTYCRLMHTPAIRYSVYRVQ